MIDFSGVTLPFQASDLLSSSMSLIGTLAGFVLLGIVIHFAPHLISLIRKSALPKNVGTYNAESSSERRRRLDGM